MSAHSATELEADSHFLLRLKHRVALQVPELSIVPPVPGQESNWHLGEQKQKRKRIKLHINQEQRLEFTGR